MLHAMAHKVREVGADVGLGFDGDGDRCGVVDNLGEEIFADKIGVMLARDLSKLHPNATFAVSYTHLDVYKRQGRARAADPASALPRPSPDSGDEGFARLLERLLERGQKRNEGPVPPPSLAG